MSARRLILILGDQLTHGLGALKDIDREHDHVLTPGRYVGIEEAEDDGEPLEEKIARLSAEIREGFEKRAKLQEQVLAGLGSLRAVTPDV